MNRLQETLSILTTAASEHGRVLVAFSGGKDSLCTLDLCLRSFRHVEAFHMYYVPGLESVEVMLDATRRRFGIQIRQYQHWAALRAMKEGIYGLAHHRREEWPDWTVHDVYKLAMLDAKCGLVATGAKRADSLWRRRMLNTWGKSADIIYPVVGWSTLEIGAYLKARNIPVPEKTAGSATGLDLTLNELLFLYDRWPGDFKKLCAVFPFAEAVVWRRKWYGVGVDEAKAKGAGV